MKSSDIDVRAIRREYARTHTGTGAMSSCAQGRSHKVDTTDAEAEFGAAVHRYKRENNRPCPTIGEVLAVLHGLGYRLVAEPGPLRE